MRSSATTTTSPTPPRRWASNAAICTKSASNWGSTCESCASSQADSTRVGILIGGVYFIFCWFLGGLYLADVLHLGIVHGSLDYKKWFIKVVAVVNNVFGLYVDPIGWVNRHRLHHEHADHPGDPNKLSGDGFWRTLYLCVVPYPYKKLAGDEILRSRTFRVVANPIFAILPQAFSVYLFWKLVGDLN